MATFWNSIYDPDSVSVVDSSHDKEDIKRYVKDMWDDMEYARETVYGIVATCAMGHDIIPGIELRGIFHAIHKYNCEEHKHFQWGMPIDSFLYAPRTSCVHGTCQPPFPSRYLYKSEKNPTMYEVVNCFSRSKGEFPRIFPEFSCYRIKLDYVYFLRNAVYLGMNDSVFDEQGLEFLKAVLKAATNLEVLLLDHWGGEDEYEVKFFNEFCAYLSSCQAFLSNFRLVKIFSWVESKGLVVSRKNFNQLITAYFAAPTDHVQKLHITRIKIKCSDVSFECSPTIEQRYRSFKTIQISDCQFVSKYKATPKALSHWLGESISELPQSNSEPDTYFFKVGGKSGAGLSRKRKHSELESDDHDQAEK